MNKILSIYSKMFYHKVTESILSLLQDYNNNYFDIIERQSSFNGTWKHEAL